MAEFYEVQQGECARDPATMIRVIRICRKCGAKIFSDAPEGLCTGCVLETALGILPDASVGAGDDCGSFENAEANAANLAPHRKMSARVAGLLGEFYELLEEIWRGGQGIVFRSRQQSLHSICTLLVTGPVRWSS